MPENPQYTVEYRNVKHPRCEFKTGSLLIVLPKKGWTPEQVLEKYGEWIKRKQATIDTAIQKSTETSINKSRTDGELKMLVRNYAESAQKYLKTKINKIYFRRNDHEMGKPQPKQQPNNKHPTQIPTRRPHQLHNLPLNSSRTLSDREKKQVTGHVEDWKNKLIDLSHRNNLLYFKKRNEGHCRYPIRTSKAYLTDLS